MQMTVSNAGSACLPSAGFAAIGLTTGHERARAYTRAGFLVP